MERAVSVGALLFLVGAGLFAAVVGAILGRARAKSTSASVAPSGSVVDPPSAHGTAAEAAFLTLFGGFVARILITGLLEAADDSDGARLAIGWAFFLIPGIIDTIPSFFGAQPATHPSVLLALATGVGAFTGFMAGVYRIYDWKRFGILQLLGDVTWGLAGSTTGALVALFNIPFGDHADDDRSGAHRYPRGFHLKQEFAFTQGNVMSSLDDDSTQPLYKHERLHVFQNRLFGPIFMLTYLGWMAVWIVPSLIASLIKWNWRFIEGWTYRSNPWEVWAYYVQRKAAGQAEGADFRSGGEFSGFVLREVVAVTFAVPFFGLALWTLGVGALAIW